MLRQQMADAERRELGDGQPGSESGSGGEPTPGGTSQYL